MIGVIVGLVIAGIVALILTNFFSATEVSYNQFFQDMTAKKVEELYIDAYKLTYVTEGGKFQVIFPSLYGASDWFTFVEQLAEAQEKAAIAAGGTFDGVYLPGVVSFTDPNATSIWSSILPIVGVVVLAIVFWLMMRSIAGGNAKTMNIGKTKAHMQNKPNVRFADVAGAEEEKEELKEVVDFLKAPRKFADLGAKIPSGVLLVGPPGTGKTLFAKAVAGEAGVPFFSVSGSDFVEMYVGVGASRVRDLFDLAKKNQPCIIFIDEIDAVGRRRGAGLGGGHDEREQTLNQILVQMDGFETNDGIIVMAATNRADILDPALLRPGRFDRQINVNLPDVKGREQILKVHARNKPMSPDVNFRTVARITAGFSGAELANLLNEAAILAVRKGKKLIGNIELYDGINKVLMGPQKKSRVVTESDKRCTAYHEAGHAVLACLCEHCDPVHEVSIIPRGRAAGYTMTRPETDDNDVSYNKLIDNICMSLGGRVAEELVIHDVTTGASADLQHVSDIARRMVTQWGMSDKLGLVAYDNDQPPFMGMEYGGHNHSSYSQATSATIDDEIRRLIASAHERATKLLKENRKIMDNMARVLVERETIYTEEVRMLMEGKDYKEVIAYMDSQDENARKNPFVKMTEEKPAEQPVQEPVETVPAETATPVEEGTDDKKAED
ncbi:MAG: ATP-dependent zinc metalloprotease FtsH [Clostridia bacterium]|nr:ATP-dependent zinc metalloprotease FtsH [Clostridia bacterium]